jgi:ABC-type uncharacterized transport system permease subunit
VKSKGYGEKKMTQICLLPSMIFFLLATMAFVGVEYLPRLATWPRRLLWAAVILHTAYLVFWFRESGAPFIKNTADMLLLLAWVLGVVVLWLSRSERWQSLGSWVCPVILMILVASLHRGGEYSAVREIWPQLWVVPVHLVSATVSVGLFAMAFVVGAWLYRQDVRLKRHHITPETLRMPAIGHLAKVLSILLSIGWVMLTVVLATGAIMFTMQGQSLWSAGRHWVWAIIAWALYAVVLNSRLMQRRRARRGILLSLFGFAAILLTFIEAHTK